MKSRIFLTYKIVASTLLYYVVGRVLGVMIYLNIINGESPIGKLISLTCLPVEYFQSWIYDL